MSLTWVEKEKLVEAWKDFLKVQEFDGFVTVTFDPNRFAPATSAMLAMDRSSRAIGKFYDSIKVKRGQWSFIVAEQHRSGIYHCHGMTRSRTMDRDREFAGLERWLSEKCGWSRVRACRDQGDVRAYVSKYLIKRACDHRFVGNP